MAAPKTGIEARKLLDKWKAELIASGKVISLNVDSRNDWFRTGYERDRVYVRAEIEPGFDIGCPEWYHRNEKPSDNDHMYRSPPCFHTEFVWSYADTDEFRRYEAERNASDARQVNQDH